MNKKAFEILRIICCIAAALILAATVFIFVYLGWEWGIASLLVAAGLFGLMMLFKHKQEQLEEKENPSPKKGDFITGAVKKDGDKNEEL